MSPSRALRKSDSHCLPRPPRKSERRALNQPTPGPPPAQSAQPAARSPKRSLHCQSPPPSEPLQGSVATPAFPPCLRPHHTPHVDHDLHGWAAIDLRATCWGASRSGPDRVPKLTTPESPAATSIARAAANALRRFPADTWLREMHGIPLCFGDRSAAARAEARGFRTRWWASTAPITTNNTVCGL